MKKQVVSGVLGIVAVMVMTLPVAQAVEQDAVPYVSVKLGTVSPTTTHQKNCQCSTWTFEDGANLGLAAGYTMSMFRVEAEYSYRKLDALSFGRSCVPYDPLFGSLSGDQQQHSLLLMGYWLPMVGWQVAPFFGAGAGYTYIRWNNVSSDLLSGSIDSSDTVFTYKFSVGVEVNLTKQSSLIFGYSYLRPDDVRVKDTLGGVGEIGSQQLKGLDAGLIYRF